MARNKYRVYVAAYFRDFITSDEQRRNQLQHAAYHWAIYVDSKTDEDPHVYDVKELDHYHNVPNSGGWRYHANRPRFRSQRMLCQIMIGKVPLNVRVEDIESWFAPPNVSLPRPNATPIENCVSWLRDAIRVLQRHQCAENFDIMGFMNQALRMADDAFRDNPRLNKRPKKDNYTNRPL